MSSRWLLAAALLLCSCHRSRESLSAGHVGCVPSEVSISDEEHTFVSDTWIATCRDRRFVCTQDSELRIACREDLAGSPTGSPVAQVAPATPEPEPAPQEPAPPAVAAKGEPPTGAGGFEFALDATGARKACEAAGKQWRSESGVHACSGLARDAGAEATASFEFCGASTCSIELRFETPETWLPLVVGLRGKLTEKYGTPESSTSLPAACKAEPEFTRCFRDHGQRLQYSWGFGTGQRIELRIGGADTSQAPGIRVIYRKSPGGSAVDASGL